METLKSIFPENCFDNDTIIAHKLFVEENDEKMIKFLEEHDNDHTKIFIDSIDDLEHNDDLNWRPIHLICRHSTPEMIKYITDKGVNLEYENNDK